MFGRSLECDLCMDTETFKNEPISGLACGFFIISCTDFMGFKIHGMHFLFHIIAIIAFRELTFRSSASIKLYRWWAVTLETSLFSGLFSVSPIVGEGVSNASSVKKKCRPLLWIQELEKRKCETKLFILSICLHICYLLHIIWHIYLFYLCCFFSVSHLAIILVGKNPRCFECESSSVFKLPWWWLADIKAARDGWVGRAVCW